MPRCELCGSDASTLRSVHVSGAELDVCEGCEDLGTPVTSESADTPDTKYSTTDATESTSTSSDDATSQAQPTSGQGRELVSSLVPDYPTRIREAREQAQLSVAELGDRLNEKASHLQQVERGERQPSTTLQVRLEQFLNIDLTPDDVDDP